MAKRNAFYAQSGGVTAVINASACGVIEAAHKARAHISRVYAGRDGIVGIVLASHGIECEWQANPAVAGVRLVLHGLE